MLGSLRKAAGSWVAKILIGLLMLSFAVWGVADVFGNYGYDSVATVGETEIESATFQNTYQIELSSVAQRLGRQLTPDEARALGIDRRVLSDLITTATLVNQGNQMRLGISDDYIADEIADSSEFKDAFGRFDRGRFEQLLVANRLTEQGFVERSRNRAVRDQIAATVAGSLEVPDVLSTALNEYQNGQRVVEYFKLPGIAPETLDAPTADDLEKFYDTNKPRFTLPEFRKLSLLVLNPEDLTSTIEVSDDDIAQEYEARRSTYETPERRAVDQLFFSDEAKAAEASVKIKAGAEFDVVATELGYTASDIDLGLVERSDIVDETISKAAFELGKDEISEPVKGLLGAAILRVRDIQEGVLRPLDEVKDEIKNLLALSRARNEAIDFYETVEDERAGGLSLSEIGTKLNVKHVSVAAVDRSGKDPESKAPDGLPASAEILRIAFESDVGVENDPIDQTNGGFVWIDVDDVIAPALRPYDEVKSEVETLWREDKLAAAMRDKAQGLVDRGREGVTLAGLATEVGSEVLTSEPFKRGAASAPFATGLVKSVFAAPEGGFIRGHAREGDDFIVAKVNKIIAPEPIEGEAAARLETGLVTALEADLFEQYVGGLRNRFGVTVNSNTLGILTGAITDTNNTNY